VTTLFSNGVRLNRREYVTVILFVALIAVAAILKPENFQAGQIESVFQSILLSIPLIATGAMGMMMVICTKNIDISMGSVVGISGMVIGYLFKDYHFPFISGVAIALVIGLLAGALNGVLISYLGIPSLIVTLATLNTWRGLALIIGDGKEVDGFSMPAQMSLLVKTGPIPGVAWLVFIALFVVVVMGMVMRYTHFGREVYAVGSNEFAARMRGIDVRKVKFLVFSLCGMFGGLVGIMYGARYGYYNPSNTGLNFEFVVISATVIGGVSMNGGSGTIVGALLGSLLVGTIQTWIPMMRISGFYNRAVYGLIIIVALFADKAVQTGQQRSYRPGHSQ
jgi:rhamnose transport system permease protein